MKQSEIKINIEVDENYIPEKINWTATDGGVENEDSKAAFLNFWDSQAKELLKIDLWTKDFPVDDMKRFYHQIFLSMAQSYETATGEEDVTLYMVQFAEEFAIKAGIKM